MILAVCIDDKGGMTFNCRRQSRDSAQQADLLTWCGDRTLWMHPYSAPLFADSGICADEAFLEKAAQGEVCFVETCDLRGMEQQAEAVVLYRWNRTYPADLWLELDLAAYELVETVEFSGTSHETITREIYQRKENCHG